MSTPHKNRCGQSEVTCAYAAQALAPRDAAAAEAHIALCWIASASWRAFAQWSIGSSPGPPMCCVRRHRCRRALRFASPRRPGSGRCCRRLGGGPSRNGNRLRPGSNASCSQPTRNGTGSACWSASRPARATPRTRMRASKSCISSTESFGSTSESSFRVTTTTARLERPTSASGARQAAPAFLSPAPETSFAEAPRAPTAPTRRPPVRAGRRRALRCVEVLWHFCDCERHRPAERSFRPAATSDQSKSSRLTF